MPRSASSVSSLGGHRADRDRALALVWAGMVLGVSFLATPAKFLAPSLPLPVALDVGRHTFRTFGRVETALATLLGLRAAASAQRRLLALAPGLIVSAQVLWLRPRLDARTRQVVEDQVTPPSSRLHLAYVACEAVKLAALLTFGLTVGPDEWQPVRPDPRRRSSDQEGRRLDGTRIDRRGE